MVDNYNDSYQSVGSDQLIKFRSGPNGNNTTTSRKVPRYILRAHFQGYIHFQRRA